ncbi:hypothetical protein DXF91_06565 [Enterobacter roggenkampii]|uniref:Uncharacterized protein n=1 Tax=Enterobacter roggenkampii TaxID=1812935 RepID=A0ABD7GQF8_9ENTR|nr:hypothetical protein [Enterobacter roggenkampii]RDT19309.1 hypothetical protein DXF88_07945 [Enterobacter roggenkampii]RDT24732.1 hypothetical protein DXF91_06565 [Enterobacter roggenkampii]RDT41343.1 hypothetical protein DXF89_08010 [Enterobacter roggenkampii]RDT57239.1 hypothetical protein DXF87_23675 [Enterobacter roggenkampii]
MKDDKVVHLGRKKNAFEDELLEIAQLLSQDNEDAADIDGGNQTIPSINVNGSANVIGNGNTVNNVITFTRSIQKKIQVKTADGVIDATQKFQIKSLVDEWVENFNAIKKLKLTHQKAWSLLNRHMKVNSYHEIKDINHAKAIKFLRSRLGELRNMPSAPKKVQDWRAQTIKSIQARCSEKGWQAWRKLYMQQKFEKNSMTELTDVELKQLYQTVWNKR